MAGLVPAIHALAPRNDAKGQKRTVALAAGKNASNPLWSEVEEGGTLDAALRLNFDTD
jgi:hypothetical protein